MENPISVSCSDDFEPVEAVSDSLKNLFLKDKWEEPYRKVLQNDDFVVLITLGAADFYVPILCTYSWDGELISREQLFTKYCGGEPGYWGNSTLFSDSKLVFNVIDSMISYDFDEYYEPIEGTTKTTVEQTKYIVESSGRIRKEK
jgi:hypothetical protein